MSMEMYLKENGIDDIKDDEAFMEAEYEAIRSYCESSNYRLEPDDIAVIRKRGLEDVIALIGEPEQRQRGEEA